ncbi:MAG: hypothetical protein IKQ91_03170 [Oscillospiraceae bacterium]|nr:hypothetical protein [Oscillospiraceae bacterium]
MQDAYLIECSVCCFDGMSHYYIWYENEQGENCFYTKNGKLAAFWKQQTAMEKITELGLQYRDTELFDEERLDYWLVTGSPSQIYGAEPYSAESLDADFLLDYWNLFDDAAKTLGMQLNLPAGADACYEKLFQRTGAAALMRPSHTFQPFLITYLIKKKSAEADSLCPVFSDKEPEIIRTVLKSGLDLLRQNTDYE